MVIGGYGLLVFGLAMVPGIISEGECARRASCKNNLKQIGLALHIYSTDHAGLFPDRLSDLYPGSTEKLGIFVCPSTADKISSPSEIDLNTSYGYVTGLDAEHDDPDDILAYDKPGNHRFRTNVNVLFLDGHVESMQEEELLKALAEQEAARSQRQESNRPPQ